MIVAYIVIEVDDKNIDLLGKISSIQVAAEHGRGSESLAVAIMRREGVTGEVIDHVDRHPTNNLVSNLRPATRGQNRANVGVSKNKRTNPYKGVTYKSDRPNPYYARIKKDGVMYIGKVHATAEEAARDYDRMAIALWGDFAYTNFQKEDYA